MLTREELIANVRALEARDVMSRVTAVENKTFETFRGLEEMRNVDELIRRAYRKRGILSEPAYIEAGRSALIAAATRADMRRDVAFLVPGLLEYTFDLSHEPTYFSKRHVTNEDVAALNAFFDAKDDERLRRYAFIGLRAIDFGAFQKTKRLRRLPTLDGVDCLFQLVDEFLTDGELDDETFVERTKGVQERLFRIVRIVEEKGKSAFSLPNERQDVVFFVTR